MRGTLQALAFCHSRSVAHGSMGSGSVLLSTYDDRRANDLIVKLDNFGFGRAHYACSLDLKGGALLILNISGYVACAQDLPNQRCRLMFTFDAFYEIQTS